MLQLRHIVLLKVMFSATVYASDNSCSKLATKMRSAISVAKEKKSPSKFAEKMKNSIELGHDASISIDLADKTDFISINRGEGGHLGKLREKRNSRAPQQKPVDLLSESVDESELSKPTDRVVLPDFTLE